MAPSSGHLLVPKMMKVFKFAVSKTTALIRSKLPQPSTSNAVALEPVPVRVTCQTIHPLAFLRQSRNNGQARWFSSINRNTASKLTSQIYQRPTRSAFPKFNTSKTIARQGGACFTSTLRPNLTGGALLRSAGGYTLGGIRSNGARHFSHTPVSQAQVVHDVSAAVRAFWLGGQKARFDGVDSKTGEKKWKTVSQAQDQAARVMSNACLSKASKGSVLEFKLSPTITALGAFGPSTTSFDGLQKQTLNTTGLLDCLASDFAHALQDLTAILTDLNRLSTLGDLSLSISTSEGSKTLNVHFPGCDARTVENLCIELSIRRGIIREDEEWKGAKDAEMALLFPFAESTVASSERDGSVTNYFEDPYYPEKRSPQPEALDWRNMLSSLESSPAYSTRSLTSKDSFSRVEGESIENPWAEEDRSLEASEYKSGSWRNMPLSENGGESGYEGVEGIYKFLAECDDGVRGRRNL